MPLEFDDFSQGGFVSLTNKATRDPPRPAIMGYLRIRVTTKLWGTLMSSPAAHPRDQSFGPGRNIELLRGMRRMRPSGTGRAMIASGVQVRSRISLGML